MLRIGEQRKRDLPAPVGGDFLDETPALLGGVNADAPQADRLTWLEQRP